ncbi:hypothetical protein D3C83_30040 [compost metagenome]
MRGEIGDRHRAAVFARPGGYFFREIALVERLASRLGNAFQRLRLVGEREFLTGGGRAAVRHEGFRVARLALELADLVCPQPRNRR